MLHLNVHQLNKVAQKFIMLFIVTCTCNYINVSGDSEWTFLSNSPRMGIDGSPFFHSTSTVTDMNGGQAFAFVGGRREAGGFGKLADK